MAARLASTSASSTAERVSSSLGETLQVLPQLGPRGPEILTAAQQAFVDGMSTALTLGAAVAFVGAVIARFTLPKRTPLDDAYEDAIEHRHSSPDPA